MGFFSLSLFSTSYHHHHHHLVLVRFSPYSYNSAGKKTGWTEEQEAELRQLFMENQNNPSTEKGN